MSANILSSNPGVFRFTDFGARGDYDINLGPGNGETDNLAAWNSAMKAMRDADPFDLGSGLTLEIPPGNYYFSDTAYITAGCTIQGHGRAGTSTRTAFYFATDKPGLWALSAAQADTILGFTNAEAGGTTVQDMQIRSVGGTDDTAHGFTMNARCILKNFQVLSFPGDGINIYGDTSAPDPTNTNFWYMENCISANNKGHGMFVAGLDANTGLCKQFQAFSNLKYGLYDASFLANTYVSLLLQGNGVQGYLDLSTIKANLKIYVRPLNSGFGDQMRIAFVGDSGGSVTVTQSSDKNDITVHFNPSVSTLANVFAALSGYFYYDYLPGNNPSYVLVGGDAFSLTNVTLGTGGAYYFTGAGNIGEVIGLYCELGQYSFCDAPIGVQGGTDGSQPTFSSSYGFHRTGRQITGTLDHYINPSSSDTAKFYGKFGKVSFGLLNDPARLISRRWGFHGLNPTEGTASAETNDDTGSYTERYDPVGTDFGLGWFYMYDEDGGFKTHGWSTKRAKSFGQVAGAGAGEFAIPNGFWWGAPDSAIMRWGYGTAAPGSGTHRKGELIWNTAFDAGGPLGWSCIASGSPGTWLAIGGRGTLEGFRGAGACTISRVDDGAGANATVSLNADANDVRGIITVSTVGTDLPGSDSQIAQINLSAEASAVAAYPAAPYVILTPANTAAADLALGTTVVYVLQSETTATHFFIRSGATAPLPAVTATYKWQYVIVG